MRGARLRFARLRFAGFRGAGARSFSGGARVRFAGSGGTGCVESATGLATFVLENSSGFTFANLPNQGSYRAPPGEPPPGNMFGERGCVGTWSHALRDDAFVAPALEFPVLYSRAPPLRASASVVQ